MNDKNFGIEGFKSWPALYPFFETIHLYISNLDVNLQYCFDVCWFLNCAKKFVSLSWNFALLTTKRTDAGTKERIWTWRLQRDIGSAPEVYYLTLVTNVY